MNKITQVKAFNNGFNVNDYFILLYIKDHMYMTTFKTIDIINEYPILSLSAVNIKSGIEKIEDLELIELLEWERGVFRIKYNNENIYNFFKDEEVIVKKEKKPRAQKVKEFDVPEEIKDIISYYNSMSFLPKYKSNTENGINAVKALLKNHNVDDIKDAISFADSQKWVQLKVSELWFNFTWIMIKLEDFMEGGKYRKQYAPTNKKPIFSSTEDDKIEVFL